MLTVKAFKKHLLLKSLVLAASKSFQIPNPLQFDIHRCDRQDKKEEDYYYNFYQSFAIRKSGTTLTTCSQFLKSLG